MALLRLAGLPCCALGFALQAAAGEIRITEHDERFKTKHGVWPAHVRRAIETERQKRSERTRSNQRDVPQRKLQEPTKAEDAKAPESKGRSCTCNGGEE